MTPTVAYRDVPGARIKLTYEGLRCRATIYPEGHDPRRTSTDYAGRPLLGTYATADEAVDAAVAIIGAGDERLCTVREIDRVRREISRAEAT